MDKNLLANAGDRGLVPGPRLHMLRFDPWSKIAHYTRVPRLLKPADLEPLIHKRKRSHRREKPEHSKEEQQPHSPQREKARAQKATKTQRSQK